MLYKNDVIYDLSKAKVEIEEIEKHFHGKFPVKVVYPPERIVKSKLKHNRKPDKPASISFDLKAIVKTPTGTEVWRYAENVIIDEKGFKRYTPKKFLFHGSKWLNRNDIELIYFLLMKSEYCKGGANQGTMVKFVFEDLVTEAEKRAEKKALSTKIDGLLYGENFGLPEEKLRAVAKAYFINNVDGLTLAQVQWQLDTRINSTPDGQDKFLKMVNAEDEIKTRMSIQKAMDIELLKYDVGKKTWFWQTEGEKGATIALKVPPTKSANDALYEHYLGNEEFRDDLQSALLTKDPNAGKEKGKKPDNNPEEEKE